MEKKLLTSRIKIAADALIKRFFDHNVGKSAASLSYYMLFALFPLMIFVSNILGQLQLDVESITRWLTDFLPSDIVELFESYFVHVSENSSTSLLGFSLIFTVYFPLRATKSLIYDVRRAYELGKPQRPVLFAVRHWIYTLVLFLVVALTLLFSTLGRRVLVYIMSRIDINVPKGVITSWHYLRFLLIGFIMFVAIAALYALAQDKKQPLSVILPGAVASLIAWVTVSVGFSFYAENFAKYSIIYGALGAVIVLLLWLYITAVILIMGAELNSVILRISHRHQE